jgi:hypothetical protein
MEDMLRYLDEIVEPTIKDFEANRTSVRHAFLACVTTFHAIDYLAYPNKRSASMRQKFRKNSSAFAIVDDVAHAFKHVETGDRRRPRLKADQIVTRPSAHYGIAKWDESLWGDADGGVMLKDKTDTDLLDEVRKAVTFLRALQGAREESEAPAR